MEYWGGGGGDDDDDDDDDGGGGGDGEGTGGEEEEGTGAVVVLRRMLRGRRVIMGSVFRGRERSMRESTRGTQTREGTKRDAVGCE